MSAVSDREYLTGFVTKYLDAMISHSPGSLPVASNARFTEDCIEMKPGDGLWKTIIGLTGYRRDIIDVREKNAVSFLVVNEGANPIMYVVRLKISGDKISEIETMAVHNQKEGMIFNLDNLKTVSERMALIPDKTRLSSRKEMIRIAATYPEGLKAGSFVTVDSPMAEDAFRFENGNLMAGPGCTFFANIPSEVMKTQPIPKLSELSYRTVAVDEEMGVVAVRMNFGKGSTFEGTGVLDVFHSFKIYDGLIQAAEAYCKVIPADLKSGWE